MSIDSACDLEWSNRVESLRAEGIHPLSNIGRMKDAFNEVSRVMKISAVSVQAIVSYEDSIADMVSSGLEAFEGPTGEAA